MLDRRSFVLSAVFAGVCPVIGAPLRAAASGAGRAHREFPRQDPMLVESVVTEAHRSLDAVKELVERVPELAKAAWDWGFGDWETPLGAASHTGQHEIAEFLMQHGARPTLFSAAMLGQLEVVRAFVLAQPGVQGTPGPHGITLLAHARAGGERARPVMDFLEEIGGADPAPQQVPLSESELEARVGRYDFGGGDDGVVLEVEILRGALWARRPGGTRRGLIHLGQGVFHPAGAPSVRLSLDGRGDLELQWGGESLRAAR